MKHFTTNYLLAAAGMVLAAGTASAQALTAEVPFSFRAGGKLMTPGTYRVVTGYSSFSSQFLQMASIDDKKSRVILLVRQEDAARAWMKAGVPMIAFHCVDGKCSLAKVWNGGDRSSYLLDAKPGRDANASLTMIPLTAVKAD
jgi:hypothetical protein